MLQVIKEILLGMLAIALIALPVYAFPFLWQHYPTLAKLVGVLVLLPPLLFICWGFGNLLAEFLPQKPRQRLVLGK